MHQCGCAAVDADVRMPVALPGLAKILTETRPESNVQHGGNPSDVQNSMEYHLCGNSAAAGGYQMPQACHHVESQGCSNAHVCSCFPL